VARCGWRDNYRQENPSAYTFAMALVGGHPSGLEQQERASAGLVPVILAVGALVVTVGLITYDMDPWGAIGLPLVLVALTIPVLLRTRLARVDGLGGLLVAGLVMKFFAAFGRYVLDYEWYDRVADSSGYMNRGVIIATRFREGRIGVFDLIPTGRGTDFIRELTGLTQAVVGSSAIANFMIYSWLAFIGTVALVAAARLAVPNLNLRRYALLVLFLPSMLVWAGGVGKDAIMVFSLGLFCFGAAQLFTRLPRGLLPLGVGVAGMAYVRPHLVLLALAAFGIAIGLGRRSGSSRGASSSVAVVGIGLVVLVVGFSFAVSQASGLIPGFSPDGGVNLTETLDSTQNQSSIGGSEIEAARPNSPIEYPYAFLTVMFRPFIFEASNFNALLSALESTALMGMFVVWRRDVAAGVKASLREPYPMMAALYTLAFAFAWASLGNLGIIARQRVQVLPLLVLFLCISAVGDRSTVRDTSSAGRSHRS